MIQSRQPYQWFYSSKGAQAGPVDNAELARLAAAGTLAPADLIWRDGLADWIPAAKVRGLFPEPNPSPQAEPEAAAVAAALAHVAPVPATPAASLASVAEDAAVIPYAGSSGPEAGVTPRTVELLAATRPWVVLFSILMYIGGGLLALVGAAIMLMGIVGGASARSGGIGAIGAIIGLIYLAMAMLFFLPAVYLSRYASRIAKLRATGGTRELESALDAQRAYWKFVGILTCVVFGIYVAMFVVLIVIRAL